MAEFSVSAQAPLGGRRYLLFTRQFSSQCLLTHPRDAFIHHNKRSTHLRTLLSSSCSRRPHTCVQPNQRERKNREKEQAGPSKRSATRLPQGQQNRWPLPRHTHTPTGPGYGRHSGVKGQGGWRQKAGGRGSEGRKQAGMNERREGPKRAGQEGDTDMGGHS